MGRQAGAEVKEKKRKARPPDIAADEVGEGGEGKASSVKKKKHGAKHTQEQAPEPDKPRVNEAAALEAARAASNVIRLLEQAPEEPPQATDKGRKSKKSSGESWSGKDRTDVKFGRFSKDEKSALMAGVLEYAVEHNLSTTDLSWVSQGARKGGRRGFVKDLVSRVLPHRRINCVAQLLRKMCWTPDVRKGRWTDEETERLFALVAQHGRKWVLIGRELDRHPETVKDRWRATAEGDREKRNGR
ncbi:uncharacterized protein HaLaN_19632 [Haematococcus lacustris]|uniref:Uncharacterized protein n=1 Tax=Haematococcus lacustris TaxID=44745 RepID=A0A699ZU37_HAELA|nr:uncharacterized protein HaLaN_19632 [Haematococcus lacustris]